MVNKCKKNKSYKYYNNDISLVLILCIDHYKRSDCVIPCNRILYYYLTSMNEREDRMSFREIR